MVAFKLMLSGFAPNELIPANYTCDGDNLSPSLNWMSVPDGTQSFALIVDDPDAPRGVFAHWVVYNIPPDRDGIPGKAQAGDHLDGGGIQGQNGFGNNGYDGPCPPRGEEHRYFFRLFALDTKLDLPPRATRELVFSTMEGHVIETAETSGRYRRQGT
jgi:Raf kinase inhibitor-like YbhB/YbcL family protein